MAEKPSFVLAPSSERGWFGGRALAAGSPQRVLEGLSLREAGKLLESTFDRRGPAITAALVPYDGAVTVLQYGHVQEFRSFRAGAASSASASPAGDSAGVTVDALSSDFAFYSNPALGPDAALIEEVRSPGGGPYRRGVEEVRSRIAAGEVYVLNLTYVIEGAPLMPPLDAFRTLLSRTRAEMSAFVETPGVTIASVSPERFIRVLTGPDGRTVEICPIKGTRPRGATSAADEALAAELLGDQKERAEHVMVVDLERNDLGRVCEPGSVVVDPLYEVVATPYCHQLVSTVRGQLRPQAAIADLLEATFPCGSVTGAPKVAAMRIAEELEGGARGAYCGALVVAVPGEIDSSVLIRTLEIAEGRARWGTGCGITHDSDPAAEWLETLLKASPVLGDGLPSVALRETARVVGGRVPLLDRHLARLSEGGCGPSVLGRVREAVSETLAAATRGDANECETVPETAVLRLGVTVTSDGSVAAGLSRQPSSLEVAGGPDIARVEVATLPALPQAAAKPAARRYWDRTHRSAALSGADQAVLVDRHGFLIDGSTASIWLASQGRLLTPPAPPAVAGVLRGWIFDLAPALGFRAEEAQLEWSDLELAEEVFLTNAYGGVASVKGRKGPVARALANELRERYGW